MIIHKFESQAATVPDNIAVYTGKEKITYRQLNRSANRLAHHLLSLFSGGTNLIRGGEDTRCIGLMVPYGAPQITAALAVLKTRSMYAPLDSGYPLKRLAFMIRQSGAKIILTESRYLDIALQAVETAGVEDVNVVSIDDIDLTRYPLENPEWDSHAPENLMAYIIYTSGSSGESKGVAQTCENAAYHVDNYIKSLSITSRDKLSYVSSFSHDGAVEDIYGALFSGASICPMDIRSQDGYGVKELARWVMENEITLFHCIVTVFRYAAREITDDMTFPELRVIALGGEKIRLGDIETARRFFPHVTFAHWYGMTESSVNTMAIVDKDKRIERIAIGETVPGVQLLVLNEDGEEVDPFQVGEIFIVSQFITPGYWKNPEATAKAFIQSEMGPVYRTGDLGKLGLDGSIEFMGRKDQQVKIRGFRVELGEIEHVLHSHGDVKSAAVTARLNRAGETYLCAYIVPADNEKIPAHGQLTAYLAGAVPDYMIPSYFQQLEAMPVTATGKIDRNALPEPSIETEENFVPPSSDVEIKLAEIFKTVLFGGTGVDDDVEGKKIGIHDNFFQLGGHSLKATQLISRIHQTFDVKVPLGLIFDSPTIGGLADAIAGSRNTGGYASIEPVEKKEYYPVTPAQQRFYFLHKLTPGSLAFNLPLSIPLSPDTDKERLKRVFAQLVRRHENLRTRFGIVGEQTVLQVCEPGDVTLEIEYRKDASGFVRPFDLALAPLFRVAMIERDGGAFDLMVDFHHIISDGMSRRILTRDFTALYAGEELEPLQIQYKEFAVWLNRRLHDEADDMARHETFWLDRLRPPLPVLELPVDFPRPEVRKTDGAHFYFTLGTGLTQDIYRLTGETGATFYMVLLAVYNIVLSRYTGQNDVIVGSPIAGRYHADLENIIGLVIGSVIMRNRPDPEKNFRDFLEEIKTSTVAAYENQAYPFEQILRKIDWQDAPGHEPLTDVALIVMNMDDEAAGALPSGSRLQGEEPRYSVRHVTVGSKLDISLYAVERGDNIVLVLEYCTALFKPRTIERMARHLVTALKAVTAEPGIRLADIDMTDPDEKKKLTGGQYPFYPLTHPQKRIYQTELVYGGTACNTLSFTLRYPEILDPATVQEVLNSVVARNDALRLRILKLDYQDAPCQYVAPVEPFTSGYVDFSRFPGEQQRGKLEEWIEEQNRIPFHFFNRSLFQFNIIKYNDHESGIFIKCHHIIFDGYSLIQLIDEINHLLGKNDLPLRDKQSYLCYLAEERDYLQSSRFEEHRRYWLGNLLPLPESIPLDFGSPSTPEPGTETRARVVKFPVPDDLRERLLSFCKTEKTSVYKTILAVLSLYLSRACRLDDIVIGGAGSNRPNIKQRNTMGMFASTFPMRIRIDRHCNFSRFLNDIGIQLNHIVKNYQQYPFDRLLEDLRNETGRTPQLLNVNLIGHGQIPYDNLVMEHWFSGDEPTPLVLHLNDKQGEGVLELEWVGQIALFTIPDFQKLNRALLAIMSKVIDQPGNLLTDISLLDREEKEKILYDFNATGTENRYPGEKLVHQLFADQANRTPDRVAAVFDGVSVTYKELDKRAELLAGGLLVTGVVPDSIVGIMVEPSLEMMIGLLGILKSGGAYLPVSPSFPRERVSFILKDSNAVLLLAERFPEVITVPTLSIHSTSLFGNRELSHFPSPAIAYDNEDQPKPADREFGSQLAYIIYTSGTTGRPKGVMVEHRNLLAYVNSFAAEFPVNENDIALQQASFTFDAFVEEFYPVLLNGGKLAVPNRDDIPDADRLARFIARQNVSLISVSPLLLNRLNCCDLNMLKTVRIFIGGGDRLESRYVDNLLRIPHAVVYNTYGPTESTVCASYYRCKPGDMSRVPIGKPVANYKLFVLDRFGHPLPPGIPGELCIGGPGVSRGYLNRPELTGEKYGYAHRDQFIAYNKEKEYIRCGLNQDSWSNGCGKQATGSLYFSGDLVKWDDDGNLHFLGRIDRQVKVRGYRIELGEIENRLNGFDGVKECAVTDRADSDGDVFLCAYLVMEDNGVPVDTGALRDFLKGLLPDYMVPARFVTLDKIPLTAGNKVDAGALPDPGSRVPGDSVYIAPRNELEQKLTEIWQRVLNIEKEHIGIDANFFDLGGHSLKAASVVSAVHKAINIRIPLGTFFNAPTIRGLAESVKNMDISAFEAIFPAPKQDYYPLSPAQRRMFILRQFEGEETGTGYNMPLAIPLEKLKVTALDNLKKTFENLIARHESLRTSFHLVDDVPMQKIHESGDAPFDFEYIHVQRKEEIQEAVNRFVRPFDLFRFPLMRAVVIATGEILPYDILVADMHHIISDGVSMQVLARDFTALYSGEELPPLPLQYKDYAVWQAREDRQEVLARQEHFWMEQFREEVPVLELPADFRRPPIQNFEGRHVDVFIDNSSAEKLRQVALRIEGTLYNVLAGAISILLHKLSGNDDVVLGTTVAGRRHADLEKIIGMFVGTLPLRNRPEPSKPVHVFLREVKDNTLAAMENQEYPFEELVEKLDIPRDMGRNPLFDVMFTMQNIAEKGRTGQTRDNGGQLVLNPIAKFDLTFTVREALDGLGVKIDYAAALFTDSTIRRFADYFKRIVAALPVSLEDPIFPVTQIDILSDEEKTVLLDRFNRTDAGYPREKTLHLLFREQVQRTPDRVALYYPGEPESGDSCYASASHVAYGELDRRASALADILRQYGVGEESLVAFLMNRSPEMIVVILAILKSGGAYLPLDPIYPAERIDYILADSDTRLLITDSPREGFDAVPVENAGLYIGTTVPVHPKDGAVTSPLSVSPKNAAYVIYTSGTTGKPKGVVIEHRQVVRLMKNDRFQFRFGPSDTWALFHSICFDFSVWEMYGALLYGGKLVVVPKWVARDTGEFLQLLKRQHVTVLNQTPSAFYQLAEIETGRDTSGHTVDGPIDPGLNLRYVIFGGEALKPAKLANFNKMYPDCRLINMYGITETTVHVTYKEIGPEEIRNNISNIGLPLPTLSTYVLGPSLTLQPIGVPGECCIGGEGVGRGYLNRPALTSERFVENPYKPGQRLYRSGDRVRRLPGGQMEYLGRIDHQVQIRGYRVELGEIENRLIRLPMIKDAVVLAVDDDKNLCAYVVPAAESGESFADDLRTRLAETLPEYMIPGYVVTLDFIPLTSSGKVDRKSLPAPRTESESGGGHVVPRDALEEKLAVIWNHIIFETENPEVDGQDLPFGIDDNFFHLGGHSLKATTLVARVHKELGVKVPLPEVFRAPTIREMSDYIRRSGSSRFAAIKPAETREFYPLSYAQKRMYILNQLDSDGIGYNMPQVFSMGHEDNLDFNRMKNIFLRLIQRHESLRTSFHMVAGSPVQKIHPAVRFNLPHIRSKNVRGTFKDFVCPFDLTHAPILKAAVVTTPDKMAFLMTDMHHIISDGLSMKILADEFSDFYNFSNDRELPPVPVQYKDFAVWQQEGNNRRLVARQENFWLEEFSGDLPVLDLPIDFQRPPVQRFEGDSINLDLENRLADKLRRVAADHDVTLFMLLLSSFHILLARLSGQDELVTGTVVAGRQHADLESTIGMFVNTLAIKTCPTPGKPVFAFIGEVKEKTLHAFENQEYPFETLVEKIGVARDTSRNPLFDVMFTLQEGRDRESGERSARETTAPLKNKNEAENLNPVSKFDLTLVAKDFGQELSFVFEYCTDLFRKETVQRFGNYFQSILLQIAADPGIAIGQIDMMSPEEREQVLFRFNETRADYPVDITAVRLFDRQVRRAPHRIAAVGPLHASAVPALHAGSGSGGETRTVTGEVTLTYDGLNRRANALASLLYRRGAGPGSITAVMTHRSIDMLVAVLAVLKAGGAYLPVDTASPPERIEYMLKDSAARLVLTSEEMAKQFPSSSPWHAVAVDEPASYTAEPVEPEAAAPSDIAYVIYTSGTTGQPKGTLIEHRALMNLCTWHNSYYEVTENDRATQFAGFGFDASVWEIFPYFTAGASVHIVTEETKFEIRKLIKYYDDHRISIGFLPTQFYQQFMDELDRIETLRCIVTGGDKLSRFNKKRYAVYNNYGPTENTVVTTAHRVLSVSHHIPIGKPAANQYVYILDKDTRRPQPVGVAGELCIAGDSLARGYLNRPELTAEKFIVTGGSIPCSDTVPGALTPSGQPSSVTLYCTGDMARWTGDGNIIFLGRIDRQVQIRGFRVELGEIENRVLQFDGISEAVVADIADTSGLKSLCAYVVPQPGVHIDVDKIKEFVGRTLPVYMIPRFFEEMEAIPLTPNGKVDYKKLPRPEYKSDKDFVNPRNEKEKKIAQIWAESLGIDADLIGIEGNFFDLGGNSLRLMKVHSRLKEEFAIQFSVVQLFTYPTIRGLCEYMESDTDKTPVTEDRTEIITDRRLKLKDRRKRR